MRIRHSALLVYLLLLPSFIMAQAQEKLNVLIVDGFSNHDWKQTTEMTRQILEETGLFNVSISTTPSTFDDAAWATWDPEFSAYDVVIQNTNNIQNKNMKWPSQVEKKLEDYVRSGGGLYILHSANNAFPHWPEYDRMIGLGWRPKETGIAIVIDNTGNILKIPPGQGENTFHGKRTDVVVRKLTNHPINNGFPEEWITPSLELYKYARGPAENLTVLSYAYDSLTGKNWPVDWVVQYGKGRVYNSSMGHLWKDDPYPVSFRCIGFQTTMIRAAQWLATGKTTYPVPPDFPSKTNIRVKETMPDQVKKILDRILHYLEQATPPNIIDRNTGEKITNLTTANINATLQKGDFRITSHEWGITYSGMLLAAQTTGDASFANYTETRFKFLATAIPYFQSYSKTFPTENNPLQSIIEPHSLDDAGSICASMIKGLRSGIQADLRPVIDNSINFIMTGYHRLSDGTFARNKPKPNSLWLDDLYQSVPALAQMAKLTGEQKYFDEAVRQLRLFTNRMFNKEKGIYVHGWVEGMNEQPKFHWARANGWVVMAMTELLEVLPEDHPDREAMLELFRAHVKGLVSYQSESGLWHQLVDRNDSYLETSASAMYTYGFAHGINRGWISCKDYCLPALLAWNAIIGKVNEKGQVEGTCVGTSMAFDAEFYYNRPVSAMGPHGYGPVLLAGASIYKLLRQHAHEVNESTVYKK